MENTGHIYFIMGVTGSGKSTLIKNLKNADIDNLHMPLSYKTRAIRESETHGVDAYFITHQEFEDGINNHEFLEYAVLFGGSEKYGTKYADVLENGIEKGKTVIKEIDILGLKRLRKEKPELRDSYTTIFLKITPETIKDRIVSRGDTMDIDEINSRIETAKYENMHAVELCDFIIDATKHPNEVLDEVLQIIKK